MPSLVKVVLVVALGVALALFAAACIRAIRRSRELQAQFREASPEERKQLDARMQHDSELGAYMIPLPRWEVIAGLGGVAGFVIAKALGYL